MKVRDKIQGQYNKGEINFKEMNKLYKKYENVLDSDSETVEAIEECFDRAISMMDLFKVYVPKPIKPSFEKGKAFEITRPVLPSITKRENDEIDKLFGINKEENQDV